MQSSSSAESANSESHVLQKPIVGGQILQEHGPYPIYVSFKHSKQDFIEAGAIVTLMSQPRSVLDIKGNQILVVKVKVVRQKVLLQECWVPVTELTLDDGTLRQ